MAWSSSVSVPAGGSRANTDLLPPRPQRRQAPQAVARQLRGTSVGIEQPHRRASRTQLEQDEAVAADTGVTGTEVARQPRPVADAGIRRDQQEIVAVGVRLGNRQFARHGTWNAVNT